MGSASDRSLANKAGRATIVVALVIAAGVIGWTIADSPRDPTERAAATTAPSHSGQEPSPSPDGTEQLDASTLPDVEPAGRGGGGVVGDDYPYKHLRMDSQYDPWREYVRECTSFAAWALHSRNGYEIPFYGNAVDWAKKARDRGIRVDSTPARGAIAWRGATPTNKYGHVAWVAVVDGGNVTIEEYNHRGDGRYGTRTVPATSFQYIHFKDLPAPASPPAPSPAPTPPPAPAPAPTPPPSPSPAAPVGPSAGPSTAPSPAPQPTTGASGAPSVTAPAVPAPTTIVIPPTPTTPPRPVYREQSGSHGSPTFRDPSNASGVGPRIPPMTWVDISCKVKPATTIASAMPSGYWYRIRTAPWNDEFYAVANTFWNGDVPGRTPYTHFVDWAVPDC